MVELPDDAIEAAAKAVEAVIRRYVNAGGSVGLPSAGRVGWGATPSEIGRAALAAACPLLAARVRAELSAPVEPDDLVTIFGNALAFGYINSSYSETMFGEVAALLQRVRAEAVADERRRAAREVYEIGTLYGEKYDRGAGAMNPDSWRAAAFTKYQAALDRWCEASGYAPDAAGSVPVATPPDYFVITVEADGSLTTAPGPVATPTEPLAEDDFIDLCRRVLAERGIDVARSDVGRIYDELRKRMAAPPSEPACTCDGATYYTPEQNATRRPFVINKRCPIHGETSPAPAEQPAPWCEKHPAFPADACSFCRQTVGAPPAGHPDTYECRDDHGDGRTRVPHVHARQRTEQPEER